MSEPGFLLDTNVISELHRPRAEPRVVEFLRSLIGKWTCLSVLTIGELRRGQVKLGRSDPLRAVKLSAWIDEIEAEYSGRLLPVDARIATVWGALMVDRPRPIIDTLIAATAMVHGMTLVTRNVADVRDTGVALVDPWSAG